MKRRSNALNSVGPRSSRFFELVAVVAPVLVDRLRPTRRRGLRDGRDGAAVRAAGVGLHDGVGHAVAGHVDEGDSRAHHPALGRLVAELDADERFAAGATDGEAQLPVDLQRLRHLLALVREGCGDASAEIFTLPGTALGLAAAPARSSGPVSVAASRQATATSVIMQNAQQARRARGGEGLRGVGAARDARGLGAAADGDAMVGGGAAALRAAAVAAATIAPGTGAAVMGAAVDAATLDALRRPDVAGAAIHATAHPTIARRARAAELEVGDAARGSTFSGRTRQWTEVRRGSDGGDRASRTRRASES